MSLAITRGSLSYVEPQKTSSIWLELDHLIENLNSNWQIRYFYPERYEILLKARLSTQFDPSDIHHLLEELQAVTQCSFVALCNSKNQTVFITIRR